MTAVLEYHSRTAADSLKQVPPDAAIVRGAYFRHIFSHEVFFSMYLPIDSEVNKRWVIDCSDYMSVNKIKQHLLGLTLSNILTLVIRFLRRVHMTLQAFFIILP